MIGWLLLIAVGILLVIFAVRTKHFKHRVVVVILIVVVLFFLSTGYYVTKKNNLEYDSFGNVFKSIGVYSGWLANSLNNVKTVTGYAVNLDWSSTNSSFFGPKVKATSTKK